MMKARENPFRSERVNGVRYRFLAESWSKLLGRLAFLDHRAAIVGPEGAGKTTLLEDLGSKLVSQGFDVRSGRASRSTAVELLRKLSDRTIILLDGADQVGRLDWLRFKRVTRRAAGLVITSHRTGLLPTLIECGTTPELLAGILTEIRGRTLSDTDRLARELYLKHAGNIRDALREMYDRCAVGADDQGPPRA